MSSLPLYALLLRRAFAPKFTLGDDPGENRRVYSRRTFLSSTASIAGTVYGVSAELGSPRVTLQDGVLTVTYGGRSWQINPLAFGRRARVESFKDGPNTVITLIRATLPGTDVDVSFRARLAKHSGRWWIRLDIPGMGFDGTAPLKAWLLGETELTGEVTRRRIRAGDAQFSWKVPAHLGIDSALRFRFSPKGGCVRLEDPWECEGSHVDFIPRAPTPGTLSEAHFQIRPSTTRFELGAVRIPELGITIGCAPGSAPLGCCSDGESALTGELFTHHARRQGLVLFEGPMRLLAGAGIGPGDQSSELRLERGALLSTLGHPTGQVMLAGRVSRTAHALDIGGCQLTVAGDDERPLYLQSSGGVMESVRVPVSLERVWVPLAGADAAILDVPHHPVELRLSEPETKKNRGAFPSGLIVLSRQPYLLVPLAGSSLTVRRGLDLFNLTFRFENFEIVIEDGNPWLQRRKSSDGHRWEPAKVIVGFPPQHIAETVTDLKLEPQDAGEDPGCKYADQMPCVSKARLSAPSRIVFALDAATEQPQWERQPLTIEGLTDWSELALEVHERAEEPDATFEKQMKIAGLDPQMKLDAVEPALVRQLYPPGPNATALTLTGRLVFSPARSGRFDSPRGPLDATAVPLWHARLSPEGRKTVRAIWSYNLTPGKLPLFRQGLSDDALLPLNGRDHWGLVSQTSVYGLPALRRIVELSTALTPNPIDAAKSKSPQGQVIRPQPDFPFLQELDHAQGLPAGDSGIAIPAPLRHADMILTSVGASFVAEWHGDPPRLLYPMDPISFKPIILTPDLERFRYQSQLGRDIRVEAVRKGFMLPLGVRCSFVRLVERRFFLQPDRKDPVAYLTRRSFIVFSPPRSPRPRGESVRGERRYPGVNQPFASRDFPVSELRMLTRKSPDLLNPDEDDTAPSPTEGSPVTITKHGRLVVPNYPKLSTFWPRTQPWNKGAEGDVEFKWAIDSDSTPVASHLLFVENAALSDHDLIKEVATYYRSIRTQRLWLRTARLGGARRRYAPPAGDGDTSFDTDTWLLSTRGRLDAVGQPAASDDSDDELDFFKMDARMEGADQPPFYPVVEKASVSVQSLDRLLGRPQGLIQVGFTPQYVRHGFHSSLNPSELYLSVLEPEIALDVTRQGESAGGLAKPNALVVALSRTIGPVGGVRSAGDESIRVATRSAAVSRVGAKGKFDFHAALSGNFDPNEFFGGLGNAKLLGLIPLHLILEAAGIARAPKLLERIGYGALNVFGDDALQFLRKAISLTVVDEIKRLIDYIETLGIGSVTFRDAYPTLYNRLRAFESVARDTATRLETATNLEEISDLPGRVVQESKALFAEIERTLRDPLPECFQAVLGEMSRHWKTLRSQLNRSYLEESAKLWEPLSQRVVGVCKDIQTAGLGDVLLGPEPEGDGRVPIDLCAAVMRNPAEALRRAETALFSEPFGVPLRELLVFAGGIEAETLFRLLWPEQAVKETAAAILDQAAREIAERLKPPLSPGNILTLAGAVGDSFKAIFTGIQFPAPPSDLEQRYRNVLEALTKLEPLVKSEELKKAVQPAVCAHEALFLLKDPSRKDALIEEFSSAVADQLAPTANALILDEIQRVRETLAPLVDQARGQVVARLLGFAKVLLRTLATVQESSAVAALARAPGNVRDWCRTVGGQAARAYEFAYAIAVGVTAPYDRLEKQCVALRDLAAGLRLPPSNGDPNTEETRDRIARAIAGLKVTIHQLSQTVAEFGKFRAALKDPAEATPPSDLCANPADTLKAVGRIMQARREVVERLQRVAELITNLEELYRDRQPLRALVIGVRQLLTDITSIATATDAANPQLATINTAVTELAQITGLGEYPLYQAELNARLATLKQRAAELSTRAIDGAGALRTLLQDGLHYAVEHDKGLTAEVLRTVVMVENLGKTLDDFARPSITAAASRLMAFHDAAGNLLDALNTVLATNPIVELLLNPDVVARLRNGAQEIRKDQQALKDIADSTTPAGCVSGVRTLLRDRWHSTPALVRVVASLGDLMESVLHGQVGELIDLEGLRTKMGEIEARIRQTVADLVPTKVQLAYDWRTKLGPFPSDGSVFRMLASAPDDLVLSARISVDLLTKSREAIVRGRMKPFQVHLIGDLDVVTIIFKGATFESRNGSAPDFKAEVDNVVIGDLIKFLEPLQQWLSPGKKPFYVRPTFHPPGIEAGYQFSSDMIPLGAILFLNVAVGITATLPFTDKDGTFTFNFASPEREFLISCPPYGGGGYLSLLANARSIIAFRLSLVFGAVVPIEFGPLKAQGRVLAGIYIIHYSNGADVIGAFVRASGEGQIGCFGITVCLYVGLERRGGQLSGQAKFSYSFSIGFASITFSVTAGYTASNDSTSPIDAGAAPGLQPQASRSLTAGPSPKTSVVDSCAPAHESMAVHQVLTPPKGSNWREYQTRIALVLVEADSL